MGQNQQNGAQEFREEYRAIKKDVIKVVIINSLLVAMLVGLYFADRKFGFLDKLQNLF